MSSDAHLRRDFGTPPSSDPFIDWGPDLPGRYDGGRARLLVANPRALFVTWESGSQPERWRLVVETAGQPTRVLDLPGHAGDAWVPVTANSRGQVQLVHDDATVATLPFETPPDAPSEDVSERWGRVDPQGAVQPGASIGGHAIGPEEIEGVGAAEATSSDVQRGA